MRFHIGIVGLLVGKRFSNLETAGSNSFERIARSSWIISLAAFGAILAGLLVLTSDPEQYQKWGKSIFDGIALVLILAALVLGVVALFGIPKHGTERILGQASLGMGLCAFITLLALIAIPPLERARIRTDARRKSLAILRDSEKQLKENVRSRLRGDSGSNRVSPEEELGRLQKSFDQATQNLDGNDALIMKANSAYAQKLSALITNFDAVTKNMKDAKILQPSLIKQREELTTHRQLVENFLDANAKMRDFLEHGDDNYRAEFVRLQVSQKTTESAVRNYHAKSEVMNPLLVSIRQKNEIVGKAMLKIIALQEAYWGHWKVSGADGKIHFENPAVGKFYNDDLKEIRQASKEEMETRKRALEASISAP